MSDALTYLSEVAGAREVSEVKTYRMYIDEQAVTVHVQDHGASEGEQRFSVEAYHESLSPDERHGASWGYSLGNPAGDLRMALMNVHWNQLRAKS